MQKEYTVIGRPLALKKRVAEPGTLFAENDVIGGEEELKELLDIGRAEKVEGGGAEVKGVDELLEEAARLETDLATATKEIEALKAEVEKLTADADAKDQEIEALKAEVEKLTAEITAKKDGKK